MRLVTVVGILLILLGVVSLASNGFSFKSREKVLDLGPIEATAEKERRVNLPPVLGIVALAGGIVMIIAGGQKK
jgi:uncharacterized membrane protein